MKSRGIGQTTATADGAARRWEASFEHYAKGGPLGRGDREDSA